MTPERWRQIEDLYHAALEQRPQNRTTFLLEACQGDEELRKEIESLLAQASSNSELLEQPAWEDAERLLEESTVTAMAPGARLGPHEVLSLIGSGGMGQVYKARDSRLGRLVAIKVGGQQFSERFQREARAIAALNHPNICTLYDVGTNYLVMELVEGETLTALLRKGPLPIDLVIHYGAQIADALAAAHSQGIIHRDLKPGNVMITGNGVAKLLDFGLAKQTPVNNDKFSPIQVPSAVSEAGTVAGTMPYMSPEQIQGRPVDARSDIFSFGVVLYEMASGQKPFPSDSMTSLIPAILRDSPPSLRQLRAGIPLALERVTERCLEKEPVRRYSSGSELRQAFSQFTGREMSSEARPVIRQRTVAASMALLLLAVLVGGAWLWIRKSRADWAHNIAVPEITRLIEADDLYAAYDLVKRAEKYISGDPELQHLKSRCSGPISIHTTPPGADIYIRNYMAAEDQWELLGRSPIDEVRVPWGRAVHLRIIKDGFEPLEKNLGDSWNVRSGLGSGLPREFTLHVSGAVPQGMVFVPGGSYELFSAPAVELTGYWIDKYEVTNKQYREFIDAGGYRKREFWLHPFAENGREIAWHDAMTRFQDATGRPGPSTWEFGTYPDGQEEYPAGGISWYEAAAYAEFAGKNLPTIYHWYNAAALNFITSIIRLSNFNGRGAARAGSYRGLGPHGTYDMAGNIKEWCWNATGDKRFILGGAWDEPSYSFWDHDAKPPMDRRATYGFRCVKYSRKPQAPVTAPIAGLSRDFRREKPASDGLFRVYRGLYSYDRSDPDARLEMMDDSHPHWQKQKVSLKAAYGNERVPVYVFLPRNAARPYQAVLWAPGADALVTRSSDELTRGTQLIDFVIRSGRAVIHPIYKGTYERRFVDRMPPQQNEWRDLVIYWSKDLGRSIDYLESRPDLYTNKLAYYGFSMGAGFGPMLTAVESRLKTSILLGGGLYFFRRPPESEAIHFAPRIQIPVLMLNGRDDFYFPVEGSQAPLFQLLGTPELHKRHIIFEAGHAPPVRDVMKEVIAWLDRYLGMVSTVP